MPAGYKVLPSIYDRWQKTYGKEYSAHILPRLLATIRAQKIPISTMLDVACGTGSLAVMMARRGWSVVGVDASDRMLAEAEAKIRTTRWPVTFYHQDMRDIRIPEPVQLATSMFDSLNHVESAAELGKVFRCVHRSLVPGGTFVFDLNNERCFTALWTRTETVHHRDFTLILQNRYERKRRRAYSFVTVFRRRGELYERQAELVQERYFPRPEVEEQLQKAGFGVLECEDFNFTEVKEIGKIKTWWVAKTR